MHQEQGGQAHLTSLHLVAKVVSKQTDPGWMDVQTKHFLEHIFKTKQYFHEADLAMCEADPNTFEADYAPVSLGVRSDSQIKINIVCTRCVLVLHSLGRDWVPGLYMDARILP